MSDIEYRVVCASFGQPGHHDHAFVKPTVELADRFREKKDAEARRNPRTVAIETPHKIQWRTRTEWADGTGEPAADADRGDAATE